MTTEQKKKIQNRLMALTIGTMVLLVAFMVFIGMTNRVETLLYPLGLAVFLVIYWVISDVLSIIWLHSFDGKTEEQKKSYYVYAALDAAGLAGLLYFLIDLRGTTGAIIYVACMFLKKRFRDEYRGVSNEEAEAAAEDCADTDSSETDSSDDTTGITQNHQDDDQKELIAEEEQKDCRKTGNSSETAEENGFMTIEEMMQEAEEEKAARQQRND